VLSLLSATSVLSRVSLPIRPRASWVKDFLAFRNCFGPTSCSDIVSELNSSKKTEHLLAIEKMELAWSVNIERNLSRSANCIFNKLAILIISTKMGSKSNDLKNFAGGFSVG
jgi:hypothetical protein